MGFGLCWIPLRPRQTDGLAETFGLKKTEHLPALVPQHELDEWWRNERNDFSLSVESFILGMLWWLESQGEAVMDADEKLIIASLRFVAEHRYADPDCAGMINFARKYMQTNHSEQDAQSIARVGKQYFGIESSVDLTH